MTPIKPTVGQVVTLSLLGLAATLGLLFYFVFDASRKTILESSERSRSGASREISGRVMNFLAKAPESVQQFQIDLDRGLIDPRDPAAVERALFAALQGNTDVGEITLTYGEKIGFDANGAMQLAPAPRGQVTVWRTPDSNGIDRFWRLHVRQEGGGFVAERRELASGGTTRAPVIEREEDVVVEDPTLHPTFTTPANEHFKGGLLWSDLHRAQLDANLPESKRRAEVSVQQIVTDAAGKFAGVLRVGLLAEQIDRAVQQKTTAEADDDPHRVFICDARGRLITRGLPADWVQESNEDLRITSDTVARPIVRALADPQLRAVSEDLPIVSGQFVCHGEEFLSTFCLLPGTQDWIVGIVVPRAFYLGKLTAMRNRLLAVSSGLMALLAAAGSFLLREVKRANAQIVTQSLAMNAFDFSPAPTTAAFRDVSEVLESLEKAKTAMRAMGKYIPIDLVRQLYRGNSEPRLGGEEIEVSLMFTDIKDFTTYSERLTPNELAAALGRYLDVMARIIRQETRGTIDKFMGDAIMTFWNAPELVTNHASMACLAALRCRDASRALFQSPEWRGLPPFETRFGLHQDTAFVGHFGSPDRMDYTAIGDAVNLASRLESLNKTYGTTIIVSERIAAAACEYFDFRFLDRVTVKGRSQTIEVYELLGQKDEASGLGEFAAA